MSREIPFAEQFLAESGQIIAKLDVSVLEKVAEIIAEVRASGGRMFLLGVGGSAANASHAVNDFRKIAGIEAYAPTDNVSELTARTNDEGWATVFESWLRTSRLRALDLVLVFSVGGGDLERNVSPNLVAALKLAKGVGAKIVGIVGRDGGYTAKVADACIVIPTVNPAHVTPHTEALQAVVWHLLVSHPAVKAAETKWESTAAQSEARRAVFLDRDGVLNRAVLRNGKPHPPATVAELKVIPDAKKALASLRAKGYKLLVVTNQPDVSRGITPRKAVDSINRKLASVLPLDEIFVCYHSDKDHCDCRKPKSGLLQEAAKRHNIDLATSFMVGDRWRDVEAGQNAGCRTILIENGYEERQPGRPPDVRVHSLLEAANWILQISEKGVGR
ncbi:MAG: HAD-IIIA family hydrolase [Candidatus Acidiferrum sp.]